MKLFNKIRREIGNAIAGTDLEFYRDLAEKQEKRISALIEQNLELSRLNSENERRAREARKALA